MTRLVVIVGARPQFIKIAALFPALKQRFAVKLVHTGQHHEDKMSRAFFREFQLPEPDIQLQVAGTPSQTGQMMQALEPVLQAERPDAVLVVGDTTSTLAGALTAAQLRIPVVHVEAGLRSYTDLPEELNRTLTDRVSDLLLAPSENARANLRREGLTTGVEVVGDVMLDMALKTVGRPATRPERDGLVMTVHRAENTDRSENFFAILDAAARCGEKVLFPCHPRARDLAARWKASRRTGRVQIIEPLGYAEMLRLVQSSRLVLTDSGGLQKEAYYLGRPCITLREATEWVETVEVGWNRLVGAETEAILSAIATFQPPSLRPNLYGEGNATEVIVEAISRKYERNRQKVVT